MMNIREIILSLRAAMAKEPFWDSWMLYLIYIVVVSAFCILLAQMSHGSKLRIWYYRLTHDEVIDKGVQHSANPIDSQNGVFLTHYRYQSFGASNPEEVDLNAPMVALTFDDGPNPQSTQRILDVLGSNYSRATFFVVGTNAEKYPEMLQVIASSGCEIGNHTYGHAKLTDLSEQDVEEQIDKVNRAVRKATGSDTTVIRPPYGAYDDNLLSQLQEPVVLWDLDTEDWDSRNAQTIVENVLSKIKDGDIVLMHDIYDSTAEAIEILVPKLKEQGYQIVTVSEMARYKGKELELHKAYGVIGGGE
ncbi:MAG: polysaccharide deacetylase family protein [Clostridium sp.]|nr:polysaccharide deacetylase family protein [Clostridium sp.]